MKKFKQSEIILPNELTEHRGDLFKAKRKQKGVPCTKQCCLANVIGRCNGFCFRWSNDREIVFAKAEQPEGDYTVIETSYALACRMAAERAATKLMEQ